MSISFDDAVTAANLPLGQTHGVYYMDGDTANEAEVRARLPHATLLSITVMGNLAADICDCENGDLTPAEAVTWTNKKVARGDGLVIPYADEDTWVNQGLEKALAHYAHRIKRWIAWYGQPAKVPSGYDCIQYLGNVAPGVDKNVSLDSFFTPWKPPHSSGTAHFIGSVNLMTGAWTVHGVPGLDVVFAGPASTWNAKLSLGVGAGGGHWHIISEPAS